MRVLIIGGTRFVGKHVTQRFIKAGHDVTLFNRGNNAVQPWASEAKAIIGDRKTELVDKLKGTEYDAVIDMVLYDEKEARDVLAALSGRVKHYIMISTGSVYKVMQGPLSLPFRETDPVEDNPRVSYGYHKALAEQELLSAYREQRFPVTVLRMPSVYGPYDHQAREWYFMRRILDGRTRFLLPNGGLGLFHREYAGNVAAQLEFLLEKPQSIGETYNCGHRHFQTSLDMLRMAAAQVGREVEVFTVPQSEMPWQITLSPPVLFYQSTAKLEALGYTEEVDVAQGWGLTLDYFRENPVSDWMFARDVDPFDYETEDRLIGEAKKITLM